jgi:hypothetical protein
MPHMEISNLDENTYQLQNTLADLARIMMTQKIS